MQKEQKSLQYLKKEPGLFTKIMAMCLVSRLYLIFFQKYFKKKSEAKWHLGPLLFIIYIKDKP